MHGLPSGNVFVLLRRRYVILVYFMRAILTEVQSSAVTACSERGRRTTCAAGPVLLRPISPCLLCMFPVN